MNDTKLSSLGRGYTIIKGKIIFIFIILFIVSSFLIITFFDYGLLFKIGLYDNKEALNSPIF
ncbi:MAG: hypothetical protein Q8K30_06355 [Candidatus Gracilibacteria bacterium]|nr:hypothetical protein [Candidatus Gracilibacteria bacterium]